MGSGSGTGNSNLVEMNWDPITRIVGSLGIYTKIDFENNHFGRSMSSSGMIGASPASS